jgi:hypothetical protein
MPHQNARPIVVDVCEPERVSGFPARYRASRVNARE